MTFLVFIDVGESKSFACESDWALAGNVGRGIFHRFEVRPVDLLEESVVFDVF